MLNQKVVAVVIPAYNEETQIEMVLDTIPDFVDRVVVVDDCSKDSTSEIVLSYIKQQEASELIIESTLNKNFERNRYNRADWLLIEQSKEENKNLLPSEVLNKLPIKDRIILIRHKKNGGVGQAVSTGYKWCKDHEIDCIAKMDGDGQMDPSELEAICKPIVEDNIDYVKGNRLIHRSARLMIPKIRFLGNSILSILTKIASGYWHISDTQTAFTAISLDALKGIRLDKMYKSYGYPNDMLVKLNISMCTLREVPIKPIYDVGEQSKMNIFKVIPTVSWLLLKSFFKRLWVKYLFRDFHPLFILYNLSFALLIIWIPYLYKVIKALFLGLNMSFETLFAFSFLGITGMQFFLFAMWMDIQHNEKLNK